MPHTNRVAPRGRGLPLLAGLLALPVAAAAEPATYRLEVEIGWSAATHPADWPGADAHMSDLVGTTHEDRYVLFADGRSASSGLRNVAETGRTRILAAEFEEAARKERVGARIDAPGLKTVPGRIEVTFTTTEDHPYVSFATMIAPSPDWFTGLASVNLRPEGAWVESLRLPLWAWDAGTDSGTTYTAENAETQPLQSTRLMAGPQFLGPKGLIPVGHAVLTRVAE